MNLNDYRMAVRNHDKLYDARAAVWECMDRLSDLLGSGVETDKVWDALDAANEELSDLLTVAVRNLVDAQHEMMAS